MLTGSFSVWSLKFCTLEHFSSGPFKKTRPKVKRANIIPSIPIFVPLLELVSQQVPLRTKTSLTPNHCGWQFHQKNTCHLMELASWRPKSTWSHVLTPIFQPPHSETCLFIVPFRPEIVLFFLPNGYFYCSLLRKHVSVQQAHVWFKISVSLSFPGPFSNLSNLQTWSSLHLSQIRHEMSVWWVTSIVFMSQSIQTQNDI